MWLCMRLDSDSVRLLHEDTHTHTLSLSLSLTLSLSHSLTVADENSKKDISKP